MFSQGIHLAAQSAVSVASAIDRLQTHPEEAGAIHRWYGKTYGDTYEQYHEFLASFYTFASFTEVNSEFWQRRRIQESDDNRLERRRWFQKLVSTSHDGIDGGVADFRDRAAVMITIGKHQRRELSNEFSEVEMNGAKLRWLNRLTAQLNSIASIWWAGNEVRLYPHYKVHPQTFKLETKFVLGNETGRVFTKYAVEPEQAEVFRTLLRDDVNYKCLTRSLTASGAQGTSTQMILRLFEAGLLAGYDKRGEQIHIQQRLHFDGVGVEYEV